MATLLFIAESPSLNLFLSLIIYYFWSDGWTLIGWFYFSIVASIWDILSTYTFVYLYGSGWEDEANILFQYFAKYVNPHLALMTQGLLVLFIIGIFCFFGLGQDFQFSF